MSSRELNNPVASIVPPSAPSAGLIALTETLKKRIETGEIRGVLVLIACPGKEFGRIEAGEYDLGDMLLAFEDWKYSEMKRLDPHD